jgi:hypothetical protein
LIADERVDGFELCDGISNKWTFALRFPAGTSALGPSDDEELADPREHELRRGPVEEWRRRAR